MKNTMDWISNSIEAIKETMVVLELNCLLQSTLEDISGDFLPEHDSASFIATPEPSGESKLFVAL